MRLVRHERRKHLCLEAGTVPLCGGCEGPLALIWAGLEAARQRCGCLLNYRSLWGQNFRIRFEPQLLAVPETEALPPRVVTRPPCDTDPFLALVNSGCPGLRDPAFACDDLRGS